MEETCSFWLGRVIATGKRALTRGTEKRTRYCLDVLFNNLITPDMIYTRKKPKNPEATKHDAQNIKCRKTTNWTLIYSPCQCNIFVVRVWKWRRLVKYFKCQALAHHGHKQGAQLHQRLTPSINAKANNVQAFHQN